MLLPGTRFSKAQLSREISPNVIADASGVSVFTGKSQPIIDFGQWAANKTPPVSRLLPEPVRSPEVRSAILRSPTRAAKAEGVGDDNSEMGADLLSGVDRRRRARLHRHIGRIGGCRPLPVLCLRRDLPGPADPRPHHLQGVRRQNRPNSLLRGPKGSGLRPAR